MKHLSLLILISIIFIGCEKEPKILLNFNTEPAIKFIQLIDFIEKESKIELDTIEYSKNQIISNYNRNKINKVLNKKIDNLLKLPVYKKLSDITSAFTDSTKFKGKEAFKFAFLNLPYKGTAMSGGIANSWVEYWKNDYNIKAIDFINELENNSERIKYESISLSKKYFPNIIEENQNVEIAFCFDGNRGSFRNENIIYMDILGFTDFNINTFTKVLSHELHHVIYSNWLNSRIKKKSDKEKAIFKLQSRIILEGLAQQINFIDYSSQVKELYINKELIKKLYENFVEALIEIENSDTPLSTFSEFNTKMWDDSSFLLEKYCNGEIEDKTIPRRPTYDYYISYKIYESIEKNGGFEKLQFVIEYPENLLSEFNRLRNDKDLIPKFPLEIIDLWKNNFKS
tara:strand:- start:886 stop:2082 length:1197 start_codon:yes stop_codon:yes gene_type:complete